MRKTKEDAELTRQEILHAAARIFSEKGFTKSSLEEIAREAKVTRGAIYWHFKNKAEIFDALHDLLYQPLADLILEDLKTDHPNPLQQLEQFCAQLLIDVEQDAMTRYVLILFLVKSEYPGELVQYRERHYEIKVRCMGLFRHYFENARDKDLLPADADLDLLTCALHCYIRGIIAQHFECPQSFLLKERVPSLMHLFFNNLAVGS